MDKSWSWNFPDMHLISHSRTYFGFQVSGHASSYVRVLSGNYFRTTEGLCDIFVKKT